MTANLTNRAVSETTTIIELSCTMGRMQRLVGSVVLSVVIIASTLACRAQTAFSELRMSVEPYPKHGLPAVPPVLKVTISNAGSTPLITIPSVGLCLQVTGSSGATASVGCGQRGYVGDFNSRPFDIDSSAGPIGLRPSGSYTLIISPDRDVFFFDPSLMHPGQYGLQFRLAIGDVASNVFRYVVDAPAGENQAVWNELVRGPFSDSPPPSPYLDDRYTNVIQAHPSSDYAKIAGYFQDLTLGLSARERLSRLQRYVASNPPEPFDSFFQVHLALAFQEVAEQDALAGQMDEAERLVLQGRGILQALAQSDDPFASSASKNFLKFGPWTRGDLQDYVDANTTKKMKDIVPKVNCVLTNPDRTATVWFGYSIPNNGIYDFAVGPSNGVPPPPLPRGQPTLSNRIAG